MAHTTRSIATSEGSHRSTPSSSPDEQRTRIADFRGKPVLLNLWATWCAPCVKELPSARRAGRAARRQRVHGAGGEPGYGAGEGRALRCRASASDAARSPTPIPTWG
ncbi:MAG: TlpA disulfide reductase family protein [Candidatus Sphingomonas colombiensis]|nr:TlpA disulfide reductase family protein [Sphingomonas sp.]WEK44400.1 MAG: TlpA disulfide reductase family protein [Sphingomonas sp.]